MRRRDTGFRHFFVKKPINALSDPASAGAATAETIPLNPAVTPSTLQSTICVKGWTASIRPPVSYTNRIKKQRMADMGLPLELIGDFQLDHKLPLSLGGSPDDPRNLVLQSFEGAS